MEAAVVVDVVSRPASGASSRARSERRRLALLSAAGIAIASVTWNAAPGLGWLVAITVLVALSVGGLAHGRPGLAGWVLAAASVWLASMMCWRASDWALMTALPASVAALGALALVCARRIPASRVADVAPAAWRALRELPRGTRDACSWPAVALDGQASRQTLGALRGVLVGLPLAALFAVLLSADPAFREAVSGLGGHAGAFASWSIWAIVTVIAVMVSCAVLLRLRPGAATQEVPPPEAGPYRRVGDAAAPVRAVLDELRARMRPLTWGIALAQVVAVFGLYAAANARTFFAGHALMRSRGTVTYAEYVHEGFVEVSIAALLAVTLVVAGHALLKPRGAAMRTPGGRGMTAIELALLGLAGLALASSAHRLALYEEAYGFTVLRLGVRWFQVGIAGLLFLTAARSVARAWQGWGTALAWCGVIMATGVGSFDADGWVAMRSIERARRTGQAVDYGYLRTLSEDARTALPETTSLSRDDARELFYLEVAWRRSAEHHRDGGWRAVRGLGAPAAPRIDVRRALLGPDFALD
jgi:Domain of unknown function (DUF4173)